VLTVRILRDGELVREAPFDAAAAAHAREVAARVWVDALDPTPEELSARFGYPFALGAMAIAAGVLYVAFKRRDWL
jgi:Mg2+ and Co2+ transporter CorA